MEDRNPPAHEVMADFGWGEAWRHRRVTHGEVPRVIDSVA